MGKAMDKECFQQSFNVVERVTHTGKTRSRDFVLGRRLLEIILKGCCLSVMIKLKCNGFYDNVSFFSVWENNTNLNLNL